VLSDAGGLLAERRRCRLSREIALGGAAQPTGGTRRAHITGAAVGWHHSSTTPSTAVHPHTPFHHLHRRARVSSWPSAASEPKGTASAAAGPVYGRKSSWGGPPPRVAPAKQVCKGPGRARQRGQPQPPERSSPTPMATARPTPAVGQWMGRGWTWKSKEPRPEQGEVARGRRFRPGQCLALATWRLCCGRMEAICPLHPVPRVRRVLRGSGTTA